MSSVLILWIGLPVRGHRGPKPNSTAAIAARLLLISVAWGLTGCGSGDDEHLREPASRLPQPVEVAAIRRQDMVDALTLVGTARPWESAQVHPEVAGMVQSILFTEGQPVARGDVLLKLDDSRLKAEVDSTRASFTLAEQTLRRIDSLRQSNNLAEAEYDRAVAEFERAAAELELVRTLHAKTEIRAPFDGIVGARSISPGDYVTPQAAVISVDDLSQIRVTFDVPQRYLESVQVGTTFAVRSSGVAAGRPIAGRVYFVSASIDRNTRSSQVNGMLTQPPVSLKPGMFVNVDLVLGVRQQVLAVPEGAVFMSVSGPQIVIARAVDEYFEAVFLPVELGLRGEGLVEIRTSEPIEGESVVAAGVGALALYPGTRLEPRPAVGVYNAITQF